MQILKSWSDSLRLIFSRENNKPFLGQSFDSALSLISKIIFQCPWSIRMIFGMIGFVDGNLFSDYGHNDFINMCLIFVVSVLLMYTMTMMVGIDGVNGGKKYNKEFFLYTLIFLLCNLPLFFCIGTYWIIIHLPGKAISTWVALQPIFSIGGLLALQTLYTQIYVLGSFFLPRDLGIIASIKKGLTFAFKNIPALFLLAVWSVLVGFFVYFCISAAKSIPLIILSYFIFNSSLMIANSFVLSLLVHVVDVLGVLFVCTVVFSFFIASLFVLFKRWERRGEI